MSVIFRKSNMLPTEQWTVGTDGVGDFYANGSSGENARVMGTDPFGNSDVVWQSQPNGNGNDDGGWNAASLTIDEKKLYRFSVWVKRITPSTGGTSYFGLNASANPVSLSSGAQMGNPYWDCRNIGSFTQDVWYLLVGHVYPSDHSGGTVYIHPDTAIYTTSGYNTGIGFCNIGNDLKWYPGTTYANHRAYHYYCNDNTSRIQWWEPRMDLCDGSEPKISDLRANNRNILSSTSITVEGASLKNQKISASGGVITDFGEWRIHRFNSSGTFTISSLIGTSLPIEYLVVGGGGGGGMDMGGGGGGGGFLSGKSMLTAGSYTVTVGAAGVGAPAGSTNGQPAGHQFTISATTGGNSTFNGLTATGGGFGASSYYSYAPNYGVPGNGGCGGGPSGYSNGGTIAGGTGISGQGYNGGGGGPSYYSGGGGGAGGVGVSSTSRPDGGVGKLSGILGRPFYWGGGGGGAAYSSSNGGYGGIGGGGGGAIGNTGPSGVSAVTWGSPGTWGLPNMQANKPGGNGGTNSGGGGGGGSHYNATNKGGDGGSGIVVIRYKIK